MIDDRFHHFGQYAEEGDGPAFAHFGPTMAIFRRGGWRPAPKALQNSFDKGIEGT